MYHRGRALTALDNLILVCTEGFVLDWPTDGYVYDSIVQTPPFANRAVRIMRNRFHSLQRTSTGSVWNTMAIRATGDVLRAAQITDNNCDIGGRLLYSDKGLENCVISGNITDIGATRELIHIEDGKISNVIITNNVFTSKTSQTDTQYNSSYTVPFVGIEVSNSDLISNLRITNNIFAGIRRRGIILNSRNIIKNVTIDGNQFSNCAFEDGLRPCCVEMQQSVEGFSFCHNSCTDTPYMRFMVTSNNSAAVFWKDVTCLGNATDNPNTDVIPDVATYFLPGSKTTLINTNEKVGINTKPETATLQIESNIAKILSLARPEGNTGTCYIEFGNGNGSFLMQGFPNTVGGGMWAPSESNKVALGSAAFTYSNLYLDSDGNTTSDARKKTEIRDVPEEVLEAWGEVKMRLFRFVESIEQKGDSARIHAGMVAQEVIAAFESKGIDPFDYGIVCYDEWPESTELMEVRDENGQVISDDDGNVVMEEAASPAGSRYGIRYGEAQCLEAAWQRWIMSKLERRIEALEEAVSSQ